MQRPTPRQRNFGGLHFFPTYPKPVLFLEHARSRLENALVCACFLFCQAKILADSSYPPDFTLHRVCPEAMEWPLEFAILKIEGKILNFNLAKL
jgi:hypothetical protein